MEMKDVIKKLREVTDDARSGESQNDDDRCSDRGGPIQGEGEWAARLNLDCDGSSGEVAPGMAA
jgi:hypothetical protein